MPTIQEDLNKAPLPAAPAVDPDKRLVTQRQAAFLAAKTSVAAKELAGTQVGQLETLLRWRLDPGFFRFERICGRVVKRDPATGEIQGVPHATVHIQDTDCSFLGFFPVESPWSWLFPIFCATEDIGTVVTDHCGHFCTFVPRWDIDRILTFRRERVCLLSLVKPTLLDVLTAIEKRPIPHVPGPDPGPRSFKQETLMAARQVLGERTAGQIAALSTGQRFASSTAALTRLLATPAFATSTPPPLPAHERIPFAAGGAVDLQAHFGLADRGRPLAFNRQRYAGPFLRCRDVLVAEWLPILDAPDITFRVTQDVNGSGTEQTVYSEGFFDIRWDATSIPDVTLFASAIAISTPICEGPQGIACGNEPAILTAGLMPLLPAYHDPSGFALRPNRPHPAGGISDPPAPTGLAPYLDTVQLHGCQRVNAAVFYRFRYALDGVDKGPLLGLEWWAPRLPPNLPAHVTPDAAGWYAILDAADLIFPFWLLNWETGRFPNGKYDITLQVGDAAKAVIPPDSPAVSFVVDNQAPITGFTEIRWRPKGAGPVDSGWDSAEVLPVICPLIRRPAADIQFRVQWHASADHFRDAALSAWGCDGLSLDVPAGRPTSDYAHWHENPADNGMTRTAYFELAAARPEGVYHFGIDAYGRGFNPAGSDGGPGADWFYDPGYRGSWPRQDVAIINQ